MFKTLALAVTLGMTALPVFAEHITAGELTITDPWVRATTSVARSSGGFLTVHNHGTVDDRLLSASADFAMVQVHETVQVDGVNRMQEQTDGIVIPAGESITLAPGGYHLMLMGLEHGLEMGSEQDITLHFEQAGDVTVVFEAKMRRPTDQADGEDMSDHDMSGHDMSEDGSDADGHGDH